MRVCDVQNGVGQISGPCEMWQWNAGYSILNKVWVTYFPSSWCNVPIYFSIIWLLSFIFSQLYTTHLELLLISLFLFYRKGSQDEISQIWPSNLCPWLHAKLSGQDGIRHPWDFTYLYHQSHKRNAISLFLSNIHTYIVTCSGVSELWSFN